MVLTAKPVFKGQYYEKTAKPVFKGHYDEKTLVTQDTIMGHLSCRGTFECPLSTYFAVLIQQMWHEMMPPYPPPPPHKYIHMGDQIPTC